MIQANVHQAKTQLSKLIERAEAGEEVVIARNGKPVVRLTPVEPPTSRRKIVGLLKDEVRWPSPREDQGLSGEIAAEMVSAEKFAVALLDEPEFIPARRT